MIPTLPPLSERKLSELERMLPWIFTVDGVVVARLIATIRARDEEIAALREALVSATPPAP